MIASVTLPVETGVPSAQITALAATPLKTVQPGGQETEEIDIDLGDPEVQKAAAFIQSGFRGFKSRRKPPPPAPPPPPPLSPILPSSPPPPAIIQASTVTQQVAY